MTDFESYSKGELVGLARIMGAEVEKLLGEARFREARIRQLENENESLVHEIRALNINTFSFYQTASARTLNSGLSYRDAVLNYAMGVAGEAGEVVEPCKKFGFHSKPLDREHMAEEIGDVLWYLSALASTLKLNLVDIAQNNIAKLRARHPVKFGVVT